MARVLIVDDYEGFRQAMEFCLPTFGHTVVACATGSLTPRLVAQIQTDVAIVGVSPASLQGFMICEWIGALPQLRAIPFIVLANPLTLAIEARAKALGAVAVLAKPFDWPELLRVIGVAKLSGGSGAKAN